MAGKLTPPKPEYINIDGDSNMVWADAQASAIYAFLEEISRLYNQNIGLSDDPESSTLSYVEYLIVKLKVKQSSGIAGEYLQMHVGQAHLETFLNAMKLETRWRLADGGDTPSSSWLVKGGVNSLPDTRGLFLRGYSNGLSSQDPDGYARALGS